MTPRDFSGYRGQYPDLRWTGGAGLAVSFVLNVEEGAELALSAGDSRNESRHEVNHEVIGAPDLCIARLHGRAPVGWHTKSSASVNTRRLLVEHGGFLYDSDAYDDDLPYWVTVPTGAGVRPHLVLPYAFTSRG